MPVWSRSWRPEPAEKRFEQRSDGGQDRADHNEGNEQAGDEEKALYSLALAGFAAQGRYDLKLWTALPHESATYPPA
jgi:hypothetical protein